MTQFSRYFSEVAFPVSTRQLVEIKFACSEKADGPLQIWMVIIFCLPHGRTPVISCFTNYAHDTVKR